MEQVIEFLNDNKYVNLVIEGEGLYIEEIDQNFARYIAKNKLNLCRGTLGITIEQEKISEVTSNENEVVIIMKNNLKIFLKKHLQS